MICTRRRPRRSVAANRYATWLDVRLGHFEIILKNLKECEESCKTMRELMYDGGDQRALVRDRGKRNEFQGTRFMKNIFELLYRQVKFCGKENTMVHPKRKEGLSETISPNMTTNFFNTCYVAAGKKVDGWFNSLVVCRNRVRPNEWSFMFLYKYFVARRWWLWRAKHWWPILHIPCFKMYYWRGQWTIGIGHTPVRFLAVHSS